LLNARRAGLADRRGLSMIDRLRPAIEQMQGRDDLGQAQHRPAGGCGSMQNPMGAAVTAPWGRGSSRPIPESQLEIRRAKALSLSWPSILTPRLGRPCATGCGHDAVRVTGPGMKVGRGVVRARAPALRVCSTPGRRTPPMILVLATIACNDLWRRGSPQIRLTVPAQERRGRRGRIYS